MAKPLTNTQKVYATFAGVEKAVKQIVLSGIYEMRDAAGEIADVGAGEVRELISKPGTHKPYIHKGKIRYSSSPGKPPAAQPGETLLPSITSKIISKTNQNPAIAEFGSTSPIARELEYGTKDVVPRPFMRVAALSMRHKAVDIVTKRLIKAYTRKAQKINAASTVDIEMNM